MVSVVRYGLDSSLELDLTAGALLAQCGIPSGAPLSDLPGALRDVLSNPVDYPPLAKGTTPEDRILLALGSGVPQAEEIVATLVQYLVESGVHADGITVLQTPAEAASGDGDPARLLPPAWRKQITIETHDPECRERLAYLAASASGEPILLNRAMVDADVVLPIGCTRRRKEAGCFGVHHTIYPTFSDRRTQERFRSRRALESAGPYKRRLIEEADQVGWLLGVTFTVQVVPGGGDGVLHAVAGEVRAAARRAHQLYRQAWNCSVPGRASLVVATMEGGAAQQTWHHLGQCLAAAGALVEDGGAIAVCSTLAAPPGPGVLQLAGARSDEGVLRKLERDRPEDMLPATQLVESLRRASVYLLSRLDQALVEDLNMAAIADAAEFSRLVRQHESCILLANAHRAMVEPSNGEWKGG
jgi:nickel-dependent lactate racemase